MKRYLVLENGEVFAGLALGAPCDTFGELVFTTGMNGYIETLTDPSYCGQIVLQTFPLIGNYGIIPADFEGKCCVRGYVVREACSTPSNFRCAQTLDAFLKENNIPGITGIDTRAVTRILREAGHDERRHLRRRAGGARAAARLPHHGPRAAGDDAGALHPPAGGRRAAPRGAHRLRREAQHRARAL